MVTSVSAQQQSDAAFKSSVNAPAYKSGQGPVVLIDEAHHNFHMFSGRYRPFGELLQQDGYVVRGVGEKFTPAVLSQADILVVANSLNSQNAGSWKLPTPSAFDDAEIDAIDAWVKNGGSLFLIADHMPFPGAIEALAARFGFLVTNSYAFNPGRKGRMQFRPDDGSLRAHAITNGRSSAETIPWVTSFTGQAFRIRPGIPADPLLVLGNDVTLLLPVQAWQFSDSTASLSAAGMLQGAVVRHGNGRVAKFGEAAMFTAQIAGQSRRPMGMNHPAAPHNAQFVLNVMHWLSGLLDDG